MAEPERDRSQVFFKKSGTSLSVTGRKVISLNYSGKTYMKEQTTNNRDKSSGEFSINQEMQVKIHGKVGDKITVNVDYDDTKDDAKDISVVYQGNENELVQNVSFGDIELSLPSTEFVSYNQQLFGIKANLKSSHFNMTLLGSRTKGESKTKEFTGNTEFKKVNIYDTAYMRRKYYKLNFGLSSLIPIKPSSEKIYVDKQTSSAVDNVKIFEMTGHDYNVYGSSYTGHFQLMSQLETMLNIRKWVQSMSTSLKFSNNTATTEGVEEVKTLNYSGDLRFKLMDTVDTAATYSASASDTYDITDSVKAVTAQSRTDTASLQGSFDCRKIRLTPKIDYTKTLTKSTLGTVTGNTKTTTFNLQAKSDFSVPRGLKLPFTSKIITLTNKIVWTGVASYALTRSPVTESDNKNVLTLSCSADYEISKNLRLTINGSVERLWHKKLPEEEYISYDIGSTLTFQF